MIYRTYEDLKLLKPGMNVWACAYEFDKSNTTMSLHQKPIYGKLIPYKSGYYIGGIKYFIPFKKNSKESLLSSKAVMFLSRVYADTYEECVELYNMLVQEKVDWFKQRAEETKQDFILYRSRYYERRK